MITPHEYRRRKEHRRRQRIESRLSRKRCQAVYDAMMEPEPSIYGHGVSMVGNLWISDYRYIDADEHQDYKMTQSVYDNKIRTRLKGR